MGRHLDRCPRRRSASSFAIAVLTKSDHGRLRLLAPLLMAKSQTQTTQPWDLDPCVPMLVFSRVRKDASIRSKLRLAACPTQLPRTPIRPSVGSTYEKNCRAVYPQCQAILILF